MITKACPECGSIYESGNDHDECQACKGVGHTYRLMIVTELLLSAENNAKRGYDEAAEKRRGIAANLMWYMAIMSAVRVARDEYREAMRDGLDANQAHGLAVAEMVLLARGGLNL